jgi:hypothetical protein
MIDQKIRVWSEALARGMNRRSFVQRASGTVASGIAALMLGPALANRSKSVSAAPLIPAITCSPPGPYCNTGGGDLSGCRGGGCFQHSYQGNPIPCQVYYTYYTTGCWSTVVSGGYWTCCDCKCYNNGVAVVNCGCASFNPGSQVNPL